MNERRYDNHTVLEQIALARIAKHLELEKEQQS